MRKLKLTIRTLSVLCLLFLCSCTKPNGTVSFWQSTGSGYDDTSVTVGDQSNNITSHQQSIFSCSVSGCANFTLEVGEHSYTAQEAGTNGASWSGTITVNKDECLPIELN